MSRYLTPFIGLEEAASILNCNDDQLRHSINQGDLTAYVSTPTSLPSPSIGFREEEFCSTIPLHIFWDSTLAAWSQIKPQISWIGSMAKFKTLVVADVSGNAPTRSEATLSSKSGQIDPSGEMTLSLDWSFHEKEIRTKREEVNALKTNMDKERESEAGSAMPFSHPCTDKSHPCYSRELALALLAWENAVKSGSKEKFMIRIDKFLDSQEVEVGENQRERIRTVCNPSKRGPKPGK